MQGNYILFHWLQGIDENLLEDEVDWPANVDQEETIPSTPYKLEVEAKLKEKIQETELNKACNTAYDKFLTQEFNPEQEDFEVDIGQEDQELALVAVDKGKFHSFVCTLCHFR